MRFKRKQKPSLKADDSNLDYNAKRPILLTAKHSVVQLLLERAHRDNLHEGTECGKYSPTRVLDCWIGECIENNRVEMYQMQTQEGQPNPPTNGGPTPRTAG